MHHYRTAGGTARSTTSSCTSSAPTSPTSRRASTTTPPSTTPCADCARRLPRRAPAATGHEPSVAAAPVVLAMTSTFWRNAWRYRERAYRHTFWDAGTSLSHILAVAASARVAAELVFGLRRPARQRAARRRRHARVHGGARRAGPTRGESTAAPRRSAGSTFPRGRCRRRRSTFHAITDMHLASCLPTGADAARWRSRRWRRTAPQPTGPLTELQPAARRPAGHAPARADHLPAPLDPEVRHRRGDPVRRVLHAAGPFDAWRRFRRARRRVHRSPTST